MQVSIDQAANIIQQAIAAHQPTLLVGSPGVGKSDITRQAAMKLNRQLVDVRLSQLEAVDLRGVPSIEDGRTIWNTPSFLPTDGEGILLLDEITSAQAAVQAGAYQLILDRRLGDYELPKGWDVIAAGNKATDQAIVHRMSSALKNRFLTLTIESKLEPWVIWAYANNIAGSVIGFLRYRPDLLNIFETDKIDHSSSSYATQRSWAFLSRMIPVMTHDTRFAIAAGLVGDGPATEFLAFDSIYRQLPSIETIVADPQSAALPNNPSAQYATAAMLAAHAELKIFPKIMEYTARLPSEYQVLAVKDAVKKLPILTTTPQFASWSMANKHVIF